MIESHDTMALSTHAYEDTDRGEDGARRWGLAGSILALETLKLALSVDNRARDSLVGAALAAGLLPRLLAKLDWRKDARPGGFGEEEVCFWAPSASTIIG